MTRTLPAQQPPKTLAQDHRRQEEPASADESVASTAASRQGPSGVGRELQVDVPEDGRHGDETSPNRPHSGWFTAREHEVIKGVFEGPFVCDRNTQTMEPSGMRALMMKFRVPRIPGVWQLNEAFNAEHAGEVSAPKTAVMAGFQMVETQSAVGWSFEVFLEHMGLAKLAVNDAPERRALAFSPGGGGDYFVGLEVKRSTPPIANARAGLTSLPRR